MNKFKKFIEAHNDSIKIAAKHASDFFTSKNVKIHPFPGIVTDVSEFYCETVYADILYEMAEKGSPFGFRHGLLVAAIPHGENEDGMTQFEIKFGMFV